MGVPLGLAAIALVFYLLHRRLRHGTSNTHFENTSSSLPPESTAPSDTVYQKAEIDTHPNTLAELEEPFAELDSNRTAGACSTSELDAATAVSVPIAVGPQTTSQHQHDVAENSTPAHKVGTTLQRPVSDLSSMVDALSSEVSVTPRSDEGVVLGKSGKAQEAKAEDEHESM